MFRLKNPDLVVTLKGVGTIPPVVTKEALERYTSVDPSIKNLFEEIVPVEKSTKASKEEK